MPKVIPGDQGEGMLFLTVHGGLGRLDVVGGSGLHLNKAQNVIVPSD